VQAAVEELPEELDGIANEIHINFPWGSLLKAVATGDIALLRSLRRIATPDCTLNIVIGIDPDRDRSEIVRSGLPDLSAGFIESDLLPKFQAAGFACVEHRQLANDEWRSIGTSWAKKLQVSRRNVTRLIFQATSA
jgi:16S rRNA (adenine(1408)-N(1))-methyltransferase